MSKEKSLEDQIIKDYGDIIKAGSLVAEREFITVSVSPQIDLRIRWGYTRR